MEDPSKYLAEAREHVFVYEHTAAARAVQIIIDSRGGEHLGDPPRRFHDWTPFNCDGGDAMVSVGTVTVDGEPAFLGLHLNQEPQLLGRETLVLAEVPGRAISEFIRTSQGYLRCTVGSGASEEDVRALAGKILRSFTAHIRRHRRQSASVPQVVLFPDRIQQFA